jgi:hypothetical protein
VESRAPGDRAAVVAPFRRGSIRAARRRDSQRLRRAHIRGGGDDDLSDPAGRSQAGAAGETLASGPYRWFRSHPPRAGFASAARSRLGGHELLGCAGGRSVQPRPGRRRAAQFPRGVLGRARCGLGRVQPGKRSAAAAPGRKVAGGRRDGELRRREPDACHRVAPGRRGRLGRARLRPALVVPCPAEPLATPHSAGTARPRIRRCQPRLLRPSGAPPGAGGTVHSLRHVLRALPSRRGRRSGHRHRVHLDWPTAQPSGRVRP